MMGREASEAMALHAGGEDGDIAVAGGWVWVSGSTGSSASSGIGTASSGSSSSSLFSPTWSVGDGEVDGDDGATSSSRPSDRRHLSSLSSLSSTSSESSEASQMNGAAGGPLYAMSTMKDDLPPARSSRTGLSQYYKGRSESFTSLAAVSCVEDLAKKTIPYIRRPKASRHHAAALGVIKNSLSKTVAKKAQTGRKPAASCI